MRDVFEQSKINLNFSGSYRGKRKQIKGRIFDVTASGGFMLCEYVEGIEKLFEIGKEIACFDTYDELVDKIRYYLLHDSERRRIAEAGYRRTISDHTAERRLHEIFKEVGLLKTIAQNQERYHYRMF
jgi:spore maturation protein CgeB